MTIDKETVDAAEVALLAVLQAAGVPYSTAIASAAHVVEQVVAAALQWRAGQPEVVIQGPAVVVVEDPPEAARGPKSGT